MKGANFKQKRSFNNNNSLDKMYGRLLRNNLRSVDDVGGVRSETYELIMYELTKECNYKIHSEIAYRITDGEDLNEVFFDIINRGEYYSNIIWLMRNRIESYIEEDIYNRFHK